MNTYRSSIQPQTTIVLLNPYANFRWQMFPAYIGILIGPTRVLPRQIRSIKYNKNNITHVALPMQPLWPGKSKCYSNHKVRHRHQSSDLRNASQAPTLSHSRIPTSNQFPRSNHTMKAHPPAASDLTPPSLSTRAQSLKRKFDICIQPLPYQDRIEHTT